MELTFFWISMGGLVPPGPPWIRHCSYTHLLIPNCHIKGIYRFLTISNNHGHSRDFFQIFGEATKLMDFNFNNFLQNDIREIDAQICGL